MIKLKQIDKIDFLLYEMPSCSEWTNIGFIQDLIAKYTAWKIDRKYDRYLTRIERTKEYGSGNITIK